MTAHPVTTRGWMTVDAFADEARREPPRHRIFPVEQWGGGISGIVTLDAIQVVPPAERSDDARGGCRGYRSLVRPAG
jgi:hypothetical protein